MPQNSQFRTILVTSGCGLMGTNPVKYPSRKVAFRTCRQPKTEPEAMTDYGEYHSVSHSMIDREYADAEKLEGAKNEAILCGT
jgi:hypothetical protein